MHTITATIDLEATPEQIWTILADTDGHSTWNPFITKLTGTLEVGQKLNIRIAPPGGRSMTFHPTVTAAQPAHRLAWLGHLGFPGLFDGAHSFTLTPLPGGHTRLEQSETFSGVLVGLSRGLLVKTEAGFDAMHQALLHRIRQQLPRPVGVQDT
jgi:hypothetical protein